MATKPPSWEERAKRFLKAELARADVGYRELAERLKKHGMKESEASIANKISRGTFSATFLLASLKAIEADNLAARGCLIGLKNETLLASDSLSLAIFLILDGTISSLETCHTTTK